MSEKSQIPPNFQINDLPDFEGRYTDLSIISSTDRRICYKAKDVESSQLVFIKMFDISHSPNPIAFEYFYNEPKILSLLNYHIGSEWIIPVIHTANLRGQPYFVQPFISGWALSRAMQTCVAFNVRHALGLLEDSLRLLDKIHSFGVVHGDVSPENIHIATDNPVRMDGLLPEGFTIRLVDFESARRTFGSENRRKFPVIAKIPYLAPEIAKGEPLSPQSDLFGLGVLFYELLIGYRPYVVHTVEELSKLLADSIKPIPIIYSIPKIIENFINDLIAPVPKDRIKSAADALDRVCQIKELVTCLNLTEPSYVNYVLGRINKREAGNDVEAITYRERESTLYIQLPFNHHYSPTNRPGMELRKTEQSSFAGFVSPELTMQPRRKEITSYIAVPLSDLMGKKHLVDFSIFAPVMVTPDSSFIIDLWAYLPDFRDKMIERATRQQRKIEVGSRGGLVMPMNIQLAISLKLEPFIIEKSEELFYWTGNISNISFLVKAPKELAHRFYSGYIAIIHNGMLITNLLFEIEVSDPIISNNSNKVQELKAKENRVLSAFASYSSKDRSEVKKRVQGITAVGVDVFLDVFSLRAGQMWEQELLRNIANRDIFYLFWSSNASISKYVEREWRFALKERGINFIHPIPLASPIDTPPPAELSSLHFGDMFLT